MPPEVLRPRTGGRRCLPWAIGLVAWLGLNALLLWVYYQPAAKQLVGDEGMYQRWALALMAGQSLSMNFIWPPGQAWFLAAIYAVTGVHIVAAQLVQSALLLVCVGLLYRLWRLLDQPAAALIAAALFAFNPSVIAYAHWLWPEIPQLACLLGALVLLLAAQRYPRWRALAAGVLIGVALLFKSLLVGFWPLFLLAFLRRREGRWPGFAWVRAVLFALGLAATTAPALVHGYQQTGHPVIADSSVFNLYLGLTDTDHTDYVTRNAGAELHDFLQSGATPQQRNEVYWHKVGALVAGRGFGHVLVDKLSTQYFRLFNARTLLVSQFRGPACAGHLSAYKNTTLIGPLTVYAYAMHLLVLVLAGFGIVAFRRWREPLALFMLAFFGYQLALYSGLHVMQRYLLPMLPFLCGFAGSFVLAVGLRLRGAESAALIITRWRLVLGGVLALVLLGLSTLGPLLDASCA